MNHSFLIEYLTTKYGNQHKIINGIGYQLSSLDNFELGIIKLVKSIEEYFLKTKGSVFSVNYIITGIIYLYNSVKIIYDFPYLLNNHNNKGKPSLHIIYNEAVAQLISLVLLTESMNLWNFYKKTFNLEKQTTEIIGNENYNILINDSFSISDNIVKLLESSCINKDILIKEFYDIKEKLIKRTIDLSINFYKNALKLEEKDTEIFQLFISKYKINYPIL